MYTRPMCLIDVRLINQEGMRYRLNNGYVVVLDRQDLPILRLRNQSRDEVYISVSIDGIEVSNLSIFNILIYEEFEDRVPFSKHPSVRLLGRDSSLPFDTAKTKNNPGTIEVRAGKDSQQYTDTLTMQYYYE